MHRTLPLLVLLTLLGVVPSCTGSSGEGERATIGQDTETTDVPGTADDASSPLLDTVDDTQVEAPPDAESPSEPDVPVVDDVPVADDAGGTEPSVDAVMGDTGGSPPTKLWLATELLGRPHDAGVSLSLVPAVPLEARVVVYLAGAPVLTTPTSAGQPGEPLVFELDGLAANTSYRYRVGVREPGGTEFVDRPEHGFHTVRAPGSTFVFTIQADSHLDDKSSVELYHRTLDLAADAAPDFHVDLGDTFMCDKHSEALSAEVKPAGSLEVVMARYLSEREHFGRIAHSAPLFLVNGNHEGETGFELDGTPNNIAVWATQARKRYYPNPEGNETYSTPVDPSAETLTGTRQHPYAWQWGDALFVVIDPFWYTTSKVKDGNRWAWTLGKVQYDWLRTTLLGSTAPYKFVFAHHLVGGSHSASRGGVEAAPYFEWGGKELDGTDTFAANRPGWDRPIHALFVEAGVSAFFHGHDHVYVQQELDGIVYQEVPQPSAVNFKNGATIAAEAGYVSGTIIPSSGHLRVTVRPEGATVEYVRSYLPAVESPTQVHGSVDHSYVILPKP